jgi:hypothetical protein
METEVCVWCLCGDEKERAAPERYAGLAGVQLGADILSSTRCSYLQYVSVSVHGINSLKALFVLLQH